MRRAFAAALGLLAAVVPAAAGAGPAVLLERTIVSSHPLVALDWRGRVVGSSRADRSYFATAVCPGGARVIAWRGLVDVSDVLRLPDLRRVGAGPPAARVPGTLNPTCLDAAGTRALVVRAGLSGTEGPLQLLTRHGRRTLARGVDEDFGVAGGRLAVRRVRGAALLLDARDGRVLYRLPTAETDLLEGAPDGRYVGIQHRGRVAVLDPWAPRPRLRVLPGGATDFAWLSPWRLALWPEPGFPSPFVTARIVDLAGHELGVLHRFPADESFSAVAQGRYYAVSGLHLYSAPAFVGATFGDLGRLAFYPDSLQPIER